MKNHYITFRSVTYAQKGERLLKRAGINCFLRRTPKVLANRQCGYSLQIRADDAHQAVELLQKAQVLFGKVYAMDDDGSFGELAV